MTPLYLNVKRVGERAKEMCDPGPVSIPDGHSSFGEDSLLVSFLQECHPRLAPSLLPVNHRGPVDFALFSPTLLLERDHHDDWCLLKDDKKVS